MAAGRGAFAAGGAPGEPQFGPVAVPAGLAGGLLGHDHLGALCPDGFGLAATAFGAGAGGLAINVVGTQMPTHELPKSPSRQVMSILRHDEVAAHGGSGLALESVAIRHGGN